MISRSFTGDGFSARFAPGLHGCRSVNPRINCRGKRGSRATAPVYRSPASGIDAFERIMPLRSVTVATAIVLLAFQMTTKPSNAQSPQAPIVNPQTGTEMTTYYVVLLRRGPTWTSAATPEATAVSRSHMENIQRLTQSGKMVVAGPFLEQSGDRALAGLFVLRAASAAEAKALADGDPAVKAGRFVYEIVPWLGPSTLRH